MSDERAEVPCPSCGYKQWVNLDEVDRQVGSVYRGDPTPGEYRVCCVKCGERFMITRPGKESSDE